MLSLRVANFGLRVRPFVKALRSEQQSFPSRSFSRSCPILTSDPAAATTPPVAEPKKKLSMAMKFYLEKKREHDSFIAQERSEFEMGKKHLANMMGMEVEAMTQEDIDKAIEYLFPSGLYLKDSRPMMKPPEEVRHWFFKCHKNFHCCWQTSFQQRIVKK